MNAIRRIPHKYLAPCKGINLHDMPETPLIAFVNSRSGGQVGQKILEVFSHNIGYTQVVRGSILGTRKM